VSEDLHEKVATIGESVASSHKRHDAHELELKALRDVEIKSVREKVHDLYGKFHTQAGILVGMETAVKGLHGAVDEWKIKTEENTITQIKNRATVITAVTIICGMGTAFAGFIVFVGGNLMGWW